MKKYLGILSFLLVLPLTVGTANAQIPQKKIDEAYAHAATALNQVLVNPVIHSTFNQTQQTFLRTNIDLTIGDFLDNHPLIQIFAPCLLQKFVATFETELELAALE